MCLSLLATGPFTVLAPTNAAITNLGPDIMTALSHEPVLLKQVVQYHIIPDFSVLPELALKGSVTTLEGQAITFTGSGAVSVVVNVVFPVCV